MNAEQKTDQQTGYEIVKKKQNRPRKHIYVRKS